VTRRESESALPPERGFAPQEAHTREDRSTERAKGRLRPQGGGPWGNQGFPHVGYSRRPMSLREETRPRERPLPELEAEREVDVGRAARQIGARWWLLVAGVVVGMVAGYLLALGGGDFYEAEATLYLGQPFTPTGSAPVQSIATNPTTIGELARSEAALREASRESGMRVSELRGNVSAGVVSGVSARRTPGVNPLVNLSVQGERRRQVEGAAASLAEYVVRQVSGYPNVKIRAFNEELQALEQAERSLERRLASLDAALRAAQGRDPFEQLVLISQLDNTEQRRAIVAQERLDTRQALAMAEDVEQARVVDDPVAVETTARSTRNAIIVGALIGLLLGALAALLWEPIVERRHRSA
jgi:uncharacterized protein involved in exopolysaccharide biosynthesis